MGTWSVTPSDGVSINQSTGQIDFPRNATSIDKTYTVQYKDGSHCGEMKVTQKSDCYTPGPGGDIVYATINVVNNSGHDIYIMEYFRFKCGCDGFNYCIVHAYTSAGKTMDINNTSNVLIENGQTKKFTNVMCSGDPPKDAYSYPSIILGHNIQEGDTAVMTYAVNMTSVIVQGQPWTGHFDGAYACNTITGNGGKFEDGKEYTITITGIANDERMPYCYDNGVACT